MRIQPFWHETLCYAENLLGPVVQKPDNAIHWIVIFSTFAKLVIDRYNLGLCFGYYRLEL